MTQISYDEIANQTIRDFLKSVVLIDDHWSDAQNAPALQELDLSLLNLDPQPLPPQENIELASAPQEERAPAVPMSVTDPAYLRDIGIEITKHGLLFTGFSYKDALKETAFKLAAKSDILILDWNLGVKDARPALDLLDMLKTTGSPRFIFILTDQDLSNVKASIVEHLGGEFDGTDHVFNCGHFVFSLKNKPQAEGPNTVIASQVLDEAISGIRTRYGGLLQLAALELLGQYRNCLHEVLDHFHSDTDFPFILEWLEQESPIKDSHSFNALAIDEWAARVAKRFPSISAKTISDQTVSALLANWKATSSLPSDHMEKLEKLGKEADTSFPSDVNKPKDLLDSLDKWMDSPKSSKWPESLKGRDSRKQWPKDANRKLAMHYLGLRKGVSSPIDTLTNLEVLFQSQASLPLNLNQGSVLVDDMENYFICITPTCDCCRPSRVKSRFMFLVANEVDVSSLGSYSENVIVAIRTTDNKNKLLAVELKPTHTFKIDNHSLSSNISASTTFASASTFTLKPVAQLRQARVQSLISLAAGKVIEVGLDRSELLRLLCKSN